MNGPAARPGWTPAAPGAPHPGAAGPGPGDWSGAAGSGPGDRVRPLGPRPGEWPGARAVSAGLLSARAAPPGAGPAGLLGYRRGSGPGRRIGLAAARHRRLLAATLLLGGVWVTVRAAAPPAPPTAPVLLAAHDLAAGAVVKPGDVRSGSRPADQIPASAVTAAAGQVLAAPLTAGEVVTAPRLLGPGLLAGQPTGTVAVTVRPADAADLSAVAAGNRVDVLAGPAGDGLGGSGGGSPWAGAQQVATSALVLAAIRPGQPDGGGGAAFGGGSTTQGSDQDGALVLAVDPATAARLAGARTTRPLSLVLRGTRAGR